MNPVPAAWAGAVGEGALRGVFLWGGSAQRASERGFVGAGRAVGLRNAAAWVVFSLNLKDFSQKPALSRPKIVVSNLIER